MYVYVDQCNPSNQDHKNQDHKNQDHKNQDNKNKALMFQSMLILPEMRLGHFDWSQGWSKDCLIRGSPLGWICTINPATVGMWIRERSVYREEGWAFLSLQHDWLYVAYTRTYIHVLHTIPTSYLPCPL